MSETQKSQPTVAEIAAWLGIRHEGDATRPEPLSGGFWSSAYSYRVGENEFVLRLSDMADGFTADTAAMRFAGPNLPVPEVVDTGSALGLYYAISRRHEGRFVELTPERDGNAVGHAMANLLAALRAVPPAPGEPLFWYNPDSSNSLTWQDWLRAGLVDDPGDRVSGWRGKLESSPRYDTLFRACESKIEELLPFCPERRDLVHGDLLHQNVLISDDYERVTAIFSWKCSVRGDFLFDVAWCTFWSPWHPGIAAADLWQRTHSAPDLRTDDLIDAPFRHHCYELQIAASHLGWCTWTGDDESLAAVAKAADRVLERGPLEIS